MQLLAEMSPFALVGWGAVVVLVVGWLVVSFTQPSPARAIIEWLSADAMYVALLMLFVNLSLRAHAAGNTFALVAFLFLCVLFGGGLLMALYHTLSSVRGGAKATQSATN